ncbi:uncharacterized protein [Hoplias malabaricus]|uniref:uncharacterized protein isoform X2 n=1 Tax=Hoplias malabaricus TaxID=27720 RepID=UPI0034636CFE
MMSGECFSLQSRLRSVMEALSAALVRQVCEMVDGDLACLRLQLARALNDKAAINVKMRELQSELKILRTVNNVNTAALSPCKKYRSVCIQAPEEVDAPSINGIFGKEWCSSLWDGGEPRTEEEEERPLEEETDESEHHHRSETLTIKKETSEKEICPSNMTDKDMTPTRNTDPHSPSEPNDIVEVNLVDVDEDADDDNIPNEICFISSGFLGDTDIHPVPSDLERADFTKIISPDGTVKHLLLPRDDQPGFEEHCMPIEFTEGEQPETQSFEGQQDDLVMAVCSSGSGENLNYFDKFNLQDEPEPEVELVKGVQKKFRCLECSKTFVRQSSLTLHKRSHQRQNSHTCKSCKVVFPQMNLLRTHKCLPPESSPKALAQRFGCEQCGKRFHSRANLRVHYAVHTGERPHRCSYCGRGFTQKGNLNTHERIHRGEKPFVCPTCGKCFTQKVNLNHHQGIHIRIKPSKMRKSAKKTVNSCSTRTLGASQNAP